MSKYLHLQIPEACHENWDKMNAAATGKYCNACQKNVIDFTLMSDNDLANFFKKNTANVCGRFNPAQLNTPIPVPAKKIPWLKYFFQITIPAFLFSYKASAQTGELKGKVACAQTSEKYMLGDIKWIDTARQAAEKVIKGKVIDQNGEPIAGASLVVKNTSRGTATDSLGRFRIKLPSTNTIIQVSSIGYSSKEINCLPATLTDSIELKLESSVMGLLGEVVVTKRKKKTLLIPFLSNRPLNIPNSFSLFPNPVNTNSKLNIKWKDDISSNQSVEIYNSSGNLFQQQPLRINKKSIHQTIQLKQLPAGIYIIKITDSKTGNSASQQFIVL